jgi:hypothetical protein
MERRRRFGNVDVDGLKYLRSSGSADISRSRTSSLASANAGTEEDALK